MATRTEPHPSPLQVAHAALFSVGLVALLVSTFTRDPHWLLVAGPCVTASGALIFIGSRITFRGPVGDVLRAVLGQSRVRQIRVRAVVWVVAGILISMSGVQCVRAARDSDSVQDPSVTRNYLSWR